MNRQRQTGTILAMISLSLGILSATAKVEARNHSSERRPKHAINSVSAASHSVDHRLLALRDEDSPRGDAAAKTIATKVSQHPIATASNRHPQAAPSSAATSSARAAIDGALISILRDISKAINDSDEAGKLTASSDRAAARAALETLNIALSKTHVSANRIVTDDAKDKLSRTIDAEVWESGEIVLPDGCHASLSVLWAKKINGLLNISIAGFYPQRFDTDTATNIEKPDEFVVVINGRSTLDNGFDIQSQSNVSFWLGKLSNLSVDSGFVDQKDVLAKAPVIRGLTAAKATNRTQQNSNTATRAQSNRSAQPGTAVQASVPVPGSGREIENVAPAPAVSNVATIPTSTGLVLQPGQTLDLPLRTAPPLLYEPTRPGMNIDSNSHELPAADNVPDRFKHASDGQPRLPIGELRAPMNPDGSAQLIAAPSASIPEPGQGSPNALIPPTPELLRPAIGEAPGSANTFPATAAAAPVASESKPASKQETEATAGEPPALPANASTTTPALPAANASSTTAPDAAAPVASESKPASKQETEATAGEPPALPANASATTPTLPAVNASSTTAPDAAAPVASESKPAPKLDTEATAGEPPALPANASTTTPALPANASTTTPALPAANASSTTAPDAAAPVASESKPASKQETGATAGEPPALPANASATTPTLPAANASSTTAANANSTTAPDAATPVASESKPASKQETGATAGEPPALPANARTTTPALPANASATTPTLPTATTPAKTIAEPKLPSDSAVLIHPDRAVAGECITVAVESSRNHHPEPYVDLSFNGSIVTTGTDGRATFQIPEETAPGPSLKISMPAKPDHASSSIAILQPLQKQETPQAPKIDRISNVVTAGSTVTIDGHNFNGIAEQDHVLVDGNQEARILVASPVQLKAILPSSILPGQHTICVSSSGLKSNAGHCESIAVQVQPMGKPDRAQHWVVKVVGTQHKVKVKLLNDTPNLIKLGKGTEMTLVTAGGSNNLVTLNAQRISRGPVRLTTKVEPLQ